MKSKTECRSCGRKDRWTGDEAWQRTDSGAQADKTVQDRIGKIRGLVEEHGFPDYLYEKGKPSILNNGIEFSAIYFAMLLSLFFMGGGRFVSFDYWLKRNVIKK